MMTINTTIHAGPRFFKVIEEGRATTGDIIAFFPGRDGRGEMFYINAPGFGDSYWCGMRWWLLSEMTADFVKELTEAEVIEYCPAAATPPAI